MSIEEDVLGQIKPTEAEENHIRETMEALRSRIAQTPAFKEEDIEMCLVGSIARGTHLKDPDIDMFLLFDPSVERARLEKVGVAIGREAVGGEEHYAEHPYIKGEINGLKTDIVPAYKLGDASQKLTAVDRTPFHMRYIVEHVDDGMRDEIRLLKQFMKGTGTYGAEIKTQGFSGYLSELLVIKYGYFSQTLEAASRWKRHELIYIEEKPARKYDDALIFIDPVDPNRNVASPVSLDTFARFVHAATQYLTGPNTKFFFPSPYQPMTQEEIAESMKPRADIIGIRFKRPELIDDIFYGQVGKFERAITQLLEQKDFKVLHSGAYVEDDSTTLLFEIMNASLPRAKVHLGPPVWIQENSQDFIDKWKNSESLLSGPYIEDGNWKVIMERKHTDALTLVRTNITRLDIGKDLNKIKDNLIFIGHEEIMDKASQYALSRFLDKRMPWEFK
ncbi:MAG: CCA tRNA nucleotidyltransferase [Thermoplasmata archaeon]|nr:CCA tRNA nucleotidyltransferase [Thermoplasmata archaeon]